MVYRHPMLYALLSLTFLVIAIILILLGMFTTTDGTLQGTLIILGVFMLIPAFSYFSLYNEETHYGVNIA